MLNKGMTSSAHNIIKVDKISYQSDGYDGTVVVRKKHHEGWISAPVGLDRAFTIYAGRPQTTVRFSWFVMMFSIHTNTD